MVIIGHRYSKSTFGANNFTLDSWLYHLYIFTQMNKHKGFFLLLTDTSSPDSNTNRILPLKNKRSVSRSVVCPCLSYVSHGHFHISCRNLLHCLNKEQLFRLIHNVCPWHWKTPSDFETVKRCTRKELSTFYFFKLIKHCLRVLIQYIALIKNHQKLTYTFRLYRSKFC